MPEAGTRDAGAMVPAAWVRSNANCREPQAESASICGRCIFHRRKHWNLLAPAALIRIRYRMKRRLQMVGLNSAVVLIVEDEPVIRFNILDVLEDVGHVALEAANADEALVVLKGRQDVDILFTDVNMAGSMDGIQLAKRVRAMRPNIGIIITSGMVQLDPMALPANAAFLPKPYMHDALISAIDSLMT
ncbi:response regulator [Rhizobium vallis]|uniref:Response regulator n=2 Tax=Rhizobium vallis TaxID=634290 RepID=A0A3S0Y4L1_9HYPH|nr:response regulator [Rhizobium vallis]